MPDSYYATRFTYDAGRARVWRAICEHLQRWVDPNGVVCDLGSGYGDFINAIRAREKIAVDVSGETQKHLDAAVRFVQTPVQDLHAIADGSVDVVFASNLLEHLDDSELARALGEVRRVLRSGGRFVAVQPNFRYCYREYFDDYTHKKVFTHVSLADALAAHGFAVLHVAPRFLPMSFKSVLPRSYWLTRLYLMLPFRPMGKQMLVVVGRT